MAEYQERVGRRIRQAREDKGWSQSKLALEIGPTKKGQPRDASTISRYERGKVMPGTDALESIAAALDVDVAYFMASEPKPGTPDLMGNLRAGESQLDRIESRLDEVLELLRGQDVTAAATAAVNALRAAGALDAEAQPAGDSKPPSGAKRGSPPTHAP